MAWQFALGLIIGGAVAAAIALLVARMIPAGTFIGLIGVAAAVAIMGNAVDQVRFIVSFLAGRGGGPVGFNLSQRGPGWWALGGLVLGAIVTIAVIRGDEGESSGARASTPRFLAIVGLVLSTAAFAPTEFSGFGHDTKDTLIVIAGFGVTLGLAAIAFATRLDQPESPSYVAFTTPIGVAIIGLLVGAIDSPTRLGPLMTGVAAVPLLVGGVVAFAGLVRPLAEGSGRSVTVLTTSGIGILVAVQLVIVVVVGSKAIFGTDVGFGAFTLLTG